MTPIRRSVSDPELSVVTSLYGSAGHLREFHDRMVAAAESLSDDIEVIYVNDQSPDDSLQVALDIAAEDPRVKVIDLAKNYRHLKALMCGLDHARGGRVFLVDCDLEEPPELLLEFWEDMNSSQVDVVFGVQERRRGGFFERLSGGLFHRMVRWLADEDIVENQLTARLMTRDFVVALTQHREREVYLAGLYAITGFEQKPRVVEKLSLSPSTYTLRTKLAEAVAAITAFSSKPLTMIFWLGVGITALTGPLLVWLVGRRIFFSQEIAGWTSVMVSVWFLGGLIVFLLGLIGIYLSRIYVETKQRPYVLVRARHGFEAETRRGEIADAPAGLSSTSEPDVPRRSA